jgi:hypothetical protein
MSSASLRHAVSALAGGVSPAAVSGAAAVIDLFEPELDEYAELVAGSSQRGAPAPWPDVLGLMTRGEGAGFTERVASALQSLDMPPASRDHHRFLADLFEHRRGFFKVEWHRQADGVVPAASCYFRRRPQLEDLLDQFGRRGLDRAVQDELRVLAFNLDKRTVHFVAAAFRRSAPVYHKLYFSQHVTAGTRSDVIARAARLFGRLGERAEVRDQRLRAHEHMLPDSAEDSSIFVSACFTDRERLPWLKIDYPELTPTQAAMWASDEDRPRVEREARVTCTSLGRDRLSYLGVRLQGDLAPVLKYYVDQPGAREPA